MLLSEISEERAERKPKLGRRAKKNDEKGSTKKPKAYVENIT